MPLNFTGTQAGHHQRKRTKQLGRQGLPLRRQRLAVNRFLPAQKQLVEERLALGVIALLRRLLRLYTHTREVGSPTQSIIYARICVCVHERVYACMQLTAPYLRLLLRQVRQLPPAPCPLPWLLLLLLSFPHHALQVQPQPPQLPVPCPLHRLPPHGPDELLELSSC